MDLGLARFFLFRMGEGSRTNRELPSRSLDPMLYTIYIDRSHNRDLIVGNPELSWVPLLHPTGSAEVSLIRPDYSDVALIKRAI